MSLENCSECGEKVSSLAPHCPHCGNPNISPALETNKSLLIKTYKFGALRAISSTIQFLFYIGIFVLTIYFTNDPEIRWVQLAAIAGLSFVVWSILSTAYKADLYKDKIVCYTFLGTKEFPFNTIESFETGQIWIKAKTTIGKLKIMDVDNFGELDEELKKHVLKGHN